MNVTITPRRLAGSITPPPSKSQAHRLIIAAALGEGESLLHNVACSQDIAATIRCMAELGAGLERQGDTLRITGMRAGPRSPLRRRRAWTAERAAPPCAFSCPWLWRYGAADASPAGDG